MTGKIVTFEYIVPTALAAVLAIILSIAAVYLTNKYLGPVEQTQASVGSNPKISELPHLRLSRVRLLVSGLN